MRQMDKPVTKTIVRAERQQNHSGNTSAATELIAVSDPEALSCPKCLRRLKPPVFQCGAGHLVCSSCHDELPEKNKCASCFIKTAYSSCFIPTGYSRCHGVDRILRSIGVACPNAIVTGAKEKHEKICPSKAGNVQGQGRLAKMGPCGGGGGRTWKMDMCGVSRIIKVAVWHGGAIDAVRVLYERDGQKVWTKKFGGAGGKRSKICLQSGEYLTCVKGQIGHYNGWFVVRSLTFVSNRRTFGRYGDPQGAPFQLHAAGGRIVGFHGRSGGLIDGLGTYVRMVTCLVNQTFTFPRS